MADEREVLATLVYLGAMYPQFASKLQKKDWDRMTTAYLDILGDLPADLLRRAGAEAAKKGTFFPAASEIRAAAIEMRDAAEHLPTAQDAWAEICRIKDQGGITVSQRLAWVTFPDGTREQVCVFTERRAPERDDWSHPLIDQALRGIGGWNMLMDSDLPAAERARFLEAYKDCLKRYRDERDMLPQVREAIEAIRRVGGGRPMTWEEIGQALQTATSTPILPQFAEHPTTE